MTADGCAEEKNRGAPEGREEDGRVHGHADPERPLPVIDRSVLDDIRALQQEGAPDLVDNLIALYVSEAEHTMSSLASAIDLKNTQDMFLLAHKLKSSSANVGASHLTALLRELELLGRQDKLEGTADLFVRITKEFDAVQEALKPADGKLPA